MFLYNADLPFLASEDDETVQPGSVSKAPSGQIPQGFIVGPRHRLMLALSFGFSFLFLFFLAFSKSASEIMPFWSSNPRSRWKSLYNSYIQTKRLSLSFSFTAWSIELL